MIYLYTGTPGSGKSLHAARTVYQRMVAGGGLICNFEINPEAVPKRKTEPLYIPNHELSVDMLIRYDREHHVSRKEGQTLIVIDEAQLLFNCRDFGDKKRRGWIEFFTQHRKYHYDIILITQFDRMLDRQLRSLVEYEYRHRKITNYKLIGFLFSLTGRPWFVAVERWYGMIGKDAVMGTSFFPYRDKWGAMYDSYNRFTPEAPAPGGSGVPRSGGALGRPGAVASGENVTVFPGV